MATYLKRALCMFPAFAGCLLFLQSLFLVEPNDWDIDAFLYLGSRLLKGELLYAADFETKLPLVQYLFAAAVAFGGVGAWKIMTFLVICVFGAGASFILVRDAVRRGAKLPASEWDFTILVFGLFVVLLYTLPSSMSAHLGMMAAAGAFMSLALLAAHPGQRQAALILSLSGLALSFAALIRPNYTFIVPAAFAFIFFEARSEGTAWQRVTRVSAFLAGFAAPVLLTFAPYLFIPNGIGVLIDGLRALAAYPRGMTLAALLAAQLGDHETSWFYAILYGVTFLAAELLLMRIAHRPGGMWTCAVFCIFALAALNVSLLRTHYWSHNAMIFVPYLIPLLLYVWDIAGRVLPSRGTKLFICGSAGLCAVAGLLLAQAPLTLILNPAARFDLQINQRGVDARLLDYLRQRQTAGLTFLVVDAPIYHARLGESRVGDGHPIMLFGALQGRSIGPVSDIALFAHKGSRAACEALLSARKDIIVLARRSRLSRRVFECLSTMPGFYRAVETIGDHTVLERQVSGS